MANFLHELKDDFIKRSLWEAFRLTLYGIALLAISFIPTKAIVKSVHASDYLWPIFLALGSVILIGAMRLYRRYDRSLPNFERQHVDFDILEKTITYRLLDRSNHTYTRRYRLKALRDGLDRYQDKYHWTGRGSVILASGRKEHIISQTVKRNVWQLFDVLFNRTLKENEVIDVEVTWKLEDRDNTFVPFFSAVVEEPTELLKLHLIIPPAIGVTEVIQEIGSVLGAKVPSETALVQVPHGEHTWTIENPSLLHCYELRWTW